jgi:predicted amidohydrolase
MSSHHTLKVAMAQMLVEGGRPDKNLSRAAARIAEAARLGAQVVVLPECLDLGWAHPSAGDLAQPIPGKSSDQLSRAAEAAGIYAVAGLVERGGSRLYNAAILISPSGEIVLKHRKINLLDGVENVYSVGDRLGVAETPLGTIGVNICADNFPDSLAIGHSLACMGAQIILSPCAWAVPADHDHAREPYGALWQGAYGKLARLYDLPIVGVSNVGLVEAGPWNGRRCIGCSLAVDRHGDVVLQAPYGQQADELLVIEVELRPDVPFGTSTAEALRRKGCDGP